MAKLKKPQWIGILALWACTLLAFSSSASAASLCSGAYLYNPQQQCILCSLTLFQGSICVASSSCDVCDEIVCPRTSAALASAEPANRLSKGELSPKPAEKFQALELAARR